MHSWSVFCSYPLDECDGYRACGPYDVCSVEHSPSAPAAAPPCAPPLLSQDHSISNGGAAPQRLPPPSQRCLPMVVASPSLGSAARGGLLPCPSLVSVSRPMNPFYVRINCGGDKGTTDMWVPLSVSMTCGSCFLVSMTYESHLMVLNGSVIGAITFLEPNRKLEWLCLHSKHGAEPFRSKKLEWSLSALAALEPKATLQGATRPIK
jgi:hypothetical protein